MKDMNQKEMRKAVLDLQDYFMKNGYQPLSALTITVNFMCQIVIDCSANEEKSLANWRELTKKGNEVIMSAYVSGHTN